MKYLSVCSGIEAASVAWHPLGWKPVAFSEIDSFPSQVLAHRWPGVPNLGDFTKIRRSKNLEIDLLVGGTPCQSFSLAGLRKGLDDHRGNLALEFFRLAKRLEPEWIVWENVVGVLSTHKGKDFGSILGALGFLGYGFAYRILDAQFFGIPQRRRRVFVVANRRSWRRAASVLFERDCVRRNITEIRQKRKDVAPTLSARTKGGGGLGTDFDLDGGLIVKKIAPTLNAHFGTKQGLENQHIDGGAGLFVAVHITQDPVSGKIAPAMGTGNTRGAATIGISDGRWVRRLTPRECERLQGFPDDYTLIPERPTDGPRYKALGNSMAVPVMRWIGERIDHVRLISCLY